MAGREDVREARRDVAVFARLLGRPLTDVQAAALRLEVRTSTLLAPRQTGKSTSLSVLAAWWAFRRPEQRVMIVSAGEEAAKRLLAEVRRLMAHDLLAGAVVDEGNSLVRLANASEVRSVPASERQVRGWANDLLIVDECALVPDDLLFGAALPTTAARPEARVVLASSPWGSAGAFRSFVAQGEDPDRADVQTFRWRLSDAPWITPDVIAQAEASMPRARFLQEFMAEFVDAGDSLFSTEELKAATVGYRMTAPAAASGGTVIAGADWGRAVDSHAVTLLGVLDDHGRNPRPILYVPWCEASRRSYADQIAMLVGLSPGATNSRVLRTTDPYGPAPTPPTAMGGGWTFHASGRTVRMPGQRRGGYDLAALYSERNGVGFSGTEALQERLGRRVVPVNTSQQSKEQAFSRLRRLLSENRLLLPDEPQLLRELSGLVAEPTVSGGLRIAAAGSGHDDLALSLSFCALHLDEHIAVGRPSPEPQNVEWMTTPSGITTPAVPAPRRGGLHSDRAVLRRW